MLPPSFMYELLFPILALVLPTDADAVIARVVAPIPATVAIVVERDQVDEVISPIPGGLIDPDDDAAK